MKAMDYNITETEYLTPTKKAEVKSISATLKGENDFDKAAFKEDENCNPEPSKFASTAKVTKYRYVILLLFCLYSMSNSFQWIEYSIINNIFCHYYDVSTIAVNWTSVIFMVVYIPLIFPASWLLDKKGLRCVVLIGSLGTCLGSWVKCLSVSPDRFIISMVGQTIVAVSQIFILGIPPRLAAVWFSDKEVSTSCAVGVFGNQVGIALGFLLPPLIVPNTLDKDELSGYISMLFYGVAGFTTVLFVLVLLGFKDKPTHPPSRAQAVLENEVPEKYFKSIINLIKNVHYDLLLVTYGINVGVFYAISTLLNQVVLEHFHGYEVEVGWMGLIIVISGMVGSVFCGFILDKTHRYKETTLVVYILSLAGMIAFALALRLAGFWVVFAMAGVLGFFMTGYLPLGFEFAAEITYPESEGTSSGLLNASAQVFGILFTMIGTVVTDAYDDLVTNIGLISTLVIGALLTAFIKSDLRRQKAAALHPRDSSADQLMEKANNAQCELA